VKVGRFCFIQEKMKSTLIDVMRSSLNFRLEGDKNMRMDIIVGIMFIAGLTIATSIVTYLVLHDIDKQYTTKTSTNPHI